MTFSVTHTTPFASEFGAPIYRHLSWLSLITIFLIDFLTPLGFAHGTLYLFSLFIAALSKNREWLMRIGLASILLCSAGLFIALKPADVFYPLVIANRLVSLMAITAVLSLSLLLLRLHRKSENESLTSAGTLFSQKRNEKWLNLVVESTGVGLWWYDATREKLHWSPEVAQLHGLTPGTSTEVNTAINFYPEPYLQKIQTLFKRCLEKAIPYSEELALETADGRSLWVHTTGEAQTNEQGQIVAVFGTLKDLTKNRHLARRVQETHSQLRHILRTTPMIVWTAEANGAIDYLSPALADFSGVGEEQLAEPGYWLSLVHPGDQDQCTETWSESVSTLAPYRINFRIRRHDGVYLWHHVKADPIFNEDGHVIKWYGSAKEIPADSISPETIY